MATRKKRKVLTEEAFNSIKVLLKADIPASKIKDVTGYSDSTISRVKVVGTFPEYATYLGEMQKRWREEQANRRQQIVTEQAEATPSDTPLLDASTKIMGETSAILKTADNSDRIVKLLEENNRLTARMVELWEERPIEQKGGVWNRLISKEA